MKTKKYVIETYTGWTDPSHDVKICTLEEIQKIQKHVDEILSIYELGKKVKLQPSLITV